jgi:hypothetical protein
MTVTKMHCELWEDDSGHSFFPRAATDAEYLAQLEQNDLISGSKRLVWTVDAENWEEAMQLLYDRKGWGKYQPMDEPESEEGP